jgi:hypothetical protein
MKASGTSLRLSDSWSVPGARVVAQTQQHTAQIADDAHSSHLAADFTGWERITPSLRSK